MPHTTRSVWVSIFAMSRCVCLTSDLIFSIGRWPPLWQWMPVGAHTAGWTDFWNSHSLYELLATRCLFYGWQLLVTLTLCDDEQWLMICLTDCLYVTGAILSHRAMQRYLQLLCSLLLACGSPISFRFVLDDNWILNSILATSHSQLDSGHCFRLGNVLTLRPYRKTYFCSCCCCCISSSGRHFRIPDAHSWYNGFPSLPHCQPLLDFGN